MAERLERPFGSTRKRSGSSPPSPVLDLPPMEFMASARVSCASFEIEPKDMAPVEKRFTISCAGSTSLDGDGRAAGFLGDLDAEEAADGLELVVLLVHEARELAVAVLRVEAHRMLQRRDRVRVPGMLLAAQAIGVFAADIERVAIDRRVAEGVAVAAHVLLRDLVHADAFDRRRRAEEVAVHELGLEADRVEDLRAAIGLVGRDAHLGHHLEQALADRLDVALDRLVRVHLLRQLARLDAWLRWSRRRDRD